MHVRDRWFATVNGKRLPTARHKTGKRWQATFSPSTGRRKTKCFDTKQEALDYVAAAKTDVRRGVYRDLEGGRISLNDYSAQWLELAQVQPSTRQSYANYLRWYVKPHLGVMQLGEIKPSHLRGWLRNLERQEVRTKKPPDNLPRTLSLETVKQAKQVLSALMESALADGLIASNPVRHASVRVSKPDAMESDQQVKVWSLSTVYAVRRELPPKWRALPIVMVGSGLRPGEAFGLSVDDVDFLQREIHIRRQIIIVGNRLAYSRPKHRSYRVVPLTKDVGEAMAAHLAAHPATRVDLPTDEPGGPRQDHRLIFTTRERTAIHPNYFSSKLWRPARKAAGIDDSRENGLHVLRHTFASLLIANRMEMTAVSALLGHKDPSFTWRTYAHLMPDAPHRSRLAMEEAFRASAEAESAQRTHNEAQ